MEKPKDLQRVLALRSMYLELVKSGLGSCQAAESVYKNFRHSETTGWIRNEYNQPVVAFCGPFLFSFESQKIYEERIGL